MPHVLFYNPAVDSPSCSRCDAARDLADNFCRRCGRQFTVNLPAVRPPLLPVRARTIPPSLVGSVAVLALGTGLEWLARRVAGSAARAAGRALVERSPGSAVAQRESPTDALTVDEVLYVRKVQLRR